MAPWELAAMPAAWQEYALTASIAEAEARDDLAKRAEKRSARRQRRRSGR